MFWVWIFPPGRERLEVMYSWQGKQGRKRLQLLSSAINSTNTMSWVEMQCGAQSLRGQDLGTEWDLVCKGLQPWLVYCRRDTPYPSGHCPAWLWSLPVLFLVS